MRTLRSHGYYVGSHGRCAKKEWCKLQNPISGTLYCQDNIGEYSDYCKHFIRPDFIGTIVWTINDTATWKELKQGIKKKYGASFVLPIKVDNDKFIISELNDLDNTKSIEAIIYTTDTAIATRYGTFMRYYSYRFLRDTLDNEIKILNGE